MQLHLDFVERRARMLRQLHAREAEMLQGYAWVDRNAGAVRIPIERAMDLVVEKGLPTRAESTKGDAGVKK